MKLAWATDIHLNFLTTLARRRFLESVKEQADALVVTGDIAESGLARGLHFRRRLSTQSPASGGQRTIGL